MKCPICEMDLRETKDFKDEIGEGYEKIHRKALKRATREFTIKGLQMHRERFHCRDVNDEWHELAPTYQDLFGKRR